MSRRGTPPEKHPPGTARWAVAAVLAGGICAARTAAGEVCPLEIVGTWTQAAAAGEEETVRLLRFSSDGWVTVLEGARGSPADDFEAVADVRYELEADRIRFDVRRGNEVFPPGTVFWEIVRHAADSFGAIEPGASADERLWVRTPTRRYFLTFAAREPAGGEAGSAAFVMWTQIDGRASRLEALGAHSPPAADEDEAGARFGPVPNELARDFARESGRRSDAMLRLEIDEAEYRRAHAVFDSWKVLLAAGVLPEDDPHAQALELIAAVAQSVNRCGARIRAAAPTPLPADAGEVAPGRRAFETVRGLRQANERFHVADAAFPTAWRPPPVSR